MLRRTFSRSLIALSLGLTFGHAAVAQTYPSRPITMVVPWGAGGGTDATARIVAAMMEKEMGQPVNVVNRTGGNGVVGHSAIASAPADGYTLGMITVEISMMHWAGLTDLKPTNYTPLALMNIDPAAVTGRADSPYKTVNDLLAAIKANPGKFKASGTGQGGIWHLALAGMLKDQKMELSAAPWVPSNGAAPAMNDLAAGGIEFVTCSLPESRALIDAGKARPLTIMANQPSGLYPNVPTLKTATGSNWAIGAWRGIAGPKGLPADVQAKIGAVLKKIYDSPDYQGFMQQRGFGVVYADAKGFEQFMAKGDADMGTVMKSLGLAK
jgi:tripartite-type tricarboxylate transporter receptor subunit TctC